MYETSKRWPAWSMGVLLTVMASGAPAESEPENIIKYRQGAMSALGGHMGASAQIVRGKVDYGEHLLFHAEAIEAVSRRVSDMFPEGSDFGETDAKELIWDKWEEFQKLSRKAEQAAGDYLVAVKGGDKAVIGKSFRSLADACKQCHKKFREQDE